MPTITSALSGLCTMVTLLSKLINLSSTISKALADSIDKLHSLETDGAELTQKVEGCGSELKKIQCRTETYVNSIKKLLRYANLDSTREKSVKDSIKEGNLKGLQDYIKQIFRYLQDCTGHYRDLSGALSVAIEQNDDIIVECEGKITEAKQRKTVTQVVGGTATAGMIVGAGASAAGATATAGVAISAAAGVFTFGLGTLIGLGITAAITAGAAVVGAGSAIATGIATHHIASRHFEKIRKTFLGIRDKLYTLQSEARQLDNEIFQLNEKMKPICNDTTNVDANIKERAECEQLCQMLDVLLEGVRKLHPTLANDTAPQG